MSHSSIAPTHNNTANTQKSIFKRRILSRQLWITDGSAIGLIIVLYTIQELFSYNGIGKVIALILKEKNWPENDINLFNFSKYIIGVKILLGPIIDTFYNKSFGRRKSWIIPTAMATGVITIFLSYNFEDYLVKFSGWELSGVYSLGLIFNSACNVAINGFVLSVITRENIGLVGIAMTFGINLGRLLANGLATILRDPNFCNKYIRPYLGLTNKDYPFVTFSIILNYFGVVYVLGSAIFMFYSEKKVEPQHYRSKNGIGEKINFLKNLKIILNILKRPVIFMYIILVASFSMGSFIVENAFEQKLVNLGYSESKIWNIEFVGYGVKLILPWLFHSKINCTVPLRLFNKCWFSLILLSFFSMVLIYCTRVIGGINQESDFYGQENLMNNLPDYWVYGIASFLILKIAILVTAWTCIMSFLSKISDPMVGATSLTVLIMIYNIRHLLLSPLYMKGIEYFTSYACFYDSQIGDNNEDDSKLNLNMTDCAIQKGHYSIKTDGYYIFGSICCISSMLMYISLRHRIHQIDNYTRKNWFYKGSIHVDDHSSETWFYYDTSSEDEIFKSREKSGTLNSKVVWA